MEKEYYVANEVGEDPRGPYQLDKLKELASAGEITPETMYYHQDRQVWVQLKSNDYLADIIFSASSKLRLRKKATQESTKLKKKPSHPDKEEDTSLNPAGPAVKIEDIIHAAEGKIDGKEIDKEKSEKSQAAQARAASLKMYLLMFALFTFGGVFIYQYYSELVEIYTGQEYKKLFEYPALIAGFISVFLAGFLLLGISSMISPVRIWLMLCSGFFLYYYYSIGANLLFYSMSLGGVLFFITSLCKRKRFILITASLGFVFYTFWILAVFEMVPQRITDILEQL